MSLKRKLQTARRLLGVIYRDVTHRLFTKKCKVCGQNTETEVAYSRLFYKCKRCKFVFSADEDHESVIRGMGMMGSWSGPGGGGFREYYLVKMLISDLSMNKFLLYGTGNTPTFGRLLDEGFAVTGCDISADVIDIKTRQYGPGKFISPDDLDGKQYDAIIAVEVIEHFSRPHEEFSRLVSCLTKDGIICGTTDFYDGIKVKDSNAPGYMSLRSHVSYWNKDSLNFISDKYGLQVSAFELVRPGSVLPDEKYGQLWPNKRVFFIHSNVHTSYFSKLFSETSILPIDKP